MRNFKETLEWYRKNQTAREIGFNPDNMCLKVVRTARAIPALYLTAKAAQDATPKVHRINKVKDLRRGMVLYYDDPKDNNRAGHVVTMVGRVKGGRKDSLRDILVETNSVKRGELVIVRGDYFPKHWGDRFVFGATWLNGHELDVPGHGTRVERFHDSGPAYDMRILEKAAKHRPRAKKALDRITTYVNLLPDSPKLLRVREFKDQFRQDRVLDIRLLDRAVADGRTGRVKATRDELKRIIDDLPDE